MPLTNSSPLVRAVQGHVAADNVVFGGECRFARRIDDDPSARETLAAVVVDVALDPHGDAMHAKRKDRLTRDAAEVELDRVLAFEPPSRHSVA